VQFRTRRSSTSIVFLVFFVFFVSFVFQDLGLPLE